MGFGHSDGSGQFCCKLRRKRDRGIVRFFWSITESRDRFGCFLPKLPPPDHRFGGFFLLPVRCRFPSPGQRVGVARRGNPSGGIGDAKGIFTAQYQKDITDRRWFDAPCDEAWKAFMEKCNGAATRWRVPTPPAMPAPAPWHGRCASVATICRARLSCGRRRTFGDRSAADTSAAGQGGAAAPLAFRCVRPSCRRGGKTKVDQYMCWPPLTDSVEPVMKSASSATRNSDGAGDVLGLAEAADRDAGDDLFQHVLRHGAHHLGVDIAGRDGVDGDAARARPPAPAPW